MKKKKAPAHLSTESKRLWKSAFENYSIDDQAEMILLCGLEARDRREQARQAIEKDGAVVLDRFQQQKPSPWVGIERDSAATLARCFRLLGFDLAAASELRR